MPQQLLIQSQFQNTQQVSTSTSFVDAGCAETLGIDGRYLVMASGGFGGNDAAMTGELRVNAGATEIMRAAGEGGGGSETWRTGRCQGFALVERSGSNVVLEFEERCITSSDEIRAGSMGIVCIPLDQEAAVLVEGEDWFHAGQSGSSADVSNVSNTFTNSLSQAFTLPEPTQDWVVLMSVEATFNSGRSASDKTKARFQVDGSTIGSEYVKEWEDDVDRNCFAICDIAAGLAAGSHTFRIQVANAAASAQVNAFRSNIFVIRRSKWLSIVQTVNTAGASGTNTSFDNTNIMLDTVFTSAESDAPIIMATVPLASSVSGNSATAQLRNHTTSGNLVTDAGNQQNNGGLGSDDDVLPTFLLGQQAQGSSLAYTYRVRLRTPAAGTWTAGKNAGNTAGIRSNMIVMGANVIGTDDMVDGSGAFPFER